MKGKTYDLKKLASSGKFDITVSTRFFYNTQDYFDALTDFYNNYRRDLGNYTPAFLVHSDEDRDAFIKECFEVRAIFMRLGITALLDSLMTMEDAAIARNFKEFSDGQVSFHATLKICKDTIKDSTQRWALSRKSHK
ncbi:MAG: hypothetical protein FWC89_02240 [Defluviitaleaceae bacterium]|nr:hypothetical protein [Defluviitaleaceae bacterium]